MRQYVVVACSAAVALAVNIAMDLSTDVPMLLRWAVVIGIAMVVTVLLSRWTAERTQRASAAPGESPEPLS
ncbi:hypothetical protein BG28_05955 [Nesterenkonia sp. AN1]|uniref:Uncharacterized protein n=1 Tax=Nesterenkonia aurantiaca TaxID=1436010 RepID=A0A4V3ECE8_9MICC|nr:hypothetical protein [Nesterenkonia]EXF24577.1 hypothetical protein BG28_05955 [Nesterenkonia sp. AN1]TDS86182.1 hypothetical protein EV640_104208 [Nesterenkonia aurantiaca]